MPDALPHDPTVLPPSLAATRRTTVRAAGHLYRLALRGDPVALGAAYDIALPTVACRSSAAGDRAALWLGPDEWLLLSASPMPRLDVAGGAVVDVSHRQLALLVEGPGAEDTLAAGCPLDLHRAAFPPGMCTRTVLGKAEILLWRRAEGFHLEVWRSFAAYVVGVLETAARHGGGA